MGFALDGGLSGNGTNCMTGYLNELYLGSRRSRVGLTLQLMKKQHSLMSAGRGAVGDFSGCTVFWFCPCSGTITE